MSVAVLHLREKLAKRVSRSCQAYQNCTKNSMDKRTKDCYDEVMICPGVDKFNCKAF